MTETIKTNVIIKKSVASRTYQQKFDKRLKLFIWLFCRRHAIRKFFGSLHYTRVK